MRCILEISTNNSKIQLMLLLTWILVFSIAPVSSAAKLSVEWTPSKIVKNMSPGDTFEISASFKLEGKRKSFITKIKVTRELRPFVSVDPKRFKVTSLDQGYSFSILLSVPEDTAPGKYEGALKLKRWNKKKQKWQKITPKLVIKLTVNAPQDPLSVVHSNRYPTRLAQGPDGKLYVSDAKIGSVFIYDSDLNIIGELKNLDRPLGVAVDGAGNIYVGNKGKKNVEVYNALGEFLYAIDEGNILMPNDMAFDNEGNIYVADSKSHTVKVYNSGGQWIRNIGHEDDGDENVLGGEFLFPSAVTVSYKIDESGQKVGELFVADQGHGMIQIFDLGGNFSRAYGGAIDAFSSDWEGKFARIQSLAVDNQGRLHAADCYLDKIQILDAESGDFIGSYGSFGKSAGQLNLPLDISITDSGQVVVTNAGNRRVEIIYTIP